MELQAKESDRRWDTVAAFEVLEALMARFGFRPREIVSDFQMREILLSVAATIRNVSERRADEIDIASIDARALKVGDRLQLEGGEWVLVKEIVLRVDRNALHHVIEHDDWARLAAKSVIDEMVSSQTYNDLTDLKNDRVYEEVVTAVASQIRNSAMATMGHYFGE